MSISFEQSLIDVWRQVLVENAGLVELGTEPYPVRRTPKHRLREVDFVFEGNKSGCARLASKGTAAMFQECRLWHFTKTRIDAVIR